MRGIQYNEVYNALFSSVFGSDRMSNLILGKITSSHILKN